MTNDRLVQCQLDALRGLAAVRLVVRITPDAFTPEEYVDRTYSVARIADEIEKLLASKDAEIERLASEREAAE